MKLYRIICLKRSDLDKGGSGRFKKIIYWRPERGEPIEPILPPGYTGKLAEAGIYSADDLERCCGDGHDWFARPLFRSEMNE